MSKPAILIIDIEVEPQSQTLFQIGAMRTDTGQTYESARNRHALAQATPILNDMAKGAHWLMGHNIVDYDWPLLHKHAPTLPLLSLPLIDTLRLSPLAFPQNPYHRLIKNHKIVAAALNSPLADCQACWVLFEDQCRSFAQMRETTPSEWAVFDHLAGPLPYMVGNDPYLPTQHTTLSAQQLNALVLQMLLNTDEKEDKQTKVCFSRLATLRRQDLHQPALAMPLAYTLAWLKVSGGNSVLAPWVRHQFPDTQRLIHELRDIDCQLENCAYCRQVLDARHQLQRYFTFDAFRELTGVRGGQEAIVKAGMNGEHILVILATGGGKSICFQLPALNRYFRNGGLSIVISPLQSLMKDQVDHLMDKGISGVATLNGMLSLSERADVLDKISLGDIGLLFVAPEQFRNSSFIQAISQRHINGWIFDEAHCLSKWGHDFRPDYLYAAEFIRQRHGAHLPPISCFTATAKPDVLHDITEHFRQVLGIEFRQFIGALERSNLAYEVLDTPREQKQQRIHQLLQRELSHQSGGAVIFVASRRSAENISDFLKAQQWRCAHFHAGLKPAEKADTQNQFIQGDLQIIVATNAFGMGVDKPDVRVVIHAEIPGSLENYLQEAGRAGRDQHNARCILLFDNQDIDTQFSLNHLSQLEKRDLSQIWKTLRSLPQRGDIIMTSGEILRESNSEYMSFDVDDNMADTKVKTALAWLERAGMISRHENKTRIFPARSPQYTTWDSIVTKIKHANLSQRKTQLYTTIAHIIFDAPDDKPVSTDTLMNATSTSYIEIKAILLDLEALGILSNDTHITVYLRTDSTRPAIKQLAIVLQQEELLWTLMREQIPDAQLGQWQNFSLSSACQKLRDEGAQDILPAKLKIMLQSLADDKDARKHSSGSLTLRDMGNDLLRIRFKNSQDSWETITERARLRRDICKVIVPFLLQQTHGVRSKDTMVETTFAQLQACLQQDMALTMGIEAGKEAKMLHQALLYLHKQNVITLNHGMTVIRHAMTIRTEQSAVDNKRQYLKADYAPLYDFYGEKRFQIHVMRQYALKALHSMAEGLQLVGDYFTLHEQAFKRKWFKDIPADKLNQAVSPETLDSITNTLNPVQYAIVTDQTNQNRLVLAGPGSGKTHVIVSRVAYLLRVLHQDPSAIIVLTFNRHAAIEIKRRLFSMVGHVAAAVTVLTYDSMAMRLLGRHFGEHLEFDGKLLKQWCKQAAELLSGHLQSKDAHENSQREQILAGFRYILVDEYQDIAPEQYHLISALAGRYGHEDDALTILAVGDDDQNIYAFRGSSNEYIHRFCQDYGIQKPDYLIENYRSSGYIIEAANTMIATSSQRLKENHPIQINTERAQHPAGGHWQQQDPIRQGRVRILQLNQGHMARDNRQATAVMAEITRLKSLDGSLDDTDFAILSHNNQTLEPLQAYCEQGSIDYFLASKKNQTSITRWVPFVRLIEQLRSLKHSINIQTWSHLLLKQPAHAHMQLYLHQAMHHFCDELGIDVDQADHSHIQFGPQFFIDWLYDYANTLNQQRKNGLYLGTAYSAKGLQFKHVFILDDQWHAQHRSPTQRVYYVAMTRARETLTLVHAQHNPWINTLLQHPNIDIMSCDPLHNRALNTRYLQLTMRDVDLSYVARLQNPSQQQSALAALDALQIGDPLHCHTNHRGEVLICSTQGIPIGKLAQKADRTWLTGPHSISVSELVMQYRHDEQLEKPAQWIVVLPKVVYGQQTM